MVYCVLGTTVTAVGVAGVTWATWPFILGTCTHMGTIKYM